MKSLILTIAICFVALCSCHKEEPVLTGSDYLIFGHYYGECFGERCIEIYKLEEKQVSEDTLDRYPGSSAFYQGQYVKLSQQKFDSVKDLIDYFPKVLLSEKDKVIGMPDAGDWGGLYIEYKVKDVRRFWLIDQMKSNVPSVYHQFIDKVNEKIRILE
ncbi:hypothetical protein [Parabacteroides sp. FAFU027]|uniref:hypothetical protein n=1 Tax=Parabacteroides sp. FAFU027 TaxID=2922715 RepID=UPI001FAF6A66|nr:hypothetical protein [Parabacteroides sp. FAFU027]